jgi:hypothetical protein
MLSSRFYHAARKLARHTAPEVTQALIGLALHAETTKTNA